MRFLTAGESHGKALSLIIEGLPAGLKLAENSINERLRRRQGGYGRGDRMRIESDRVEITAGLRAGETLGSPLALLVRNKDWENWREVMPAFTPADGTREVKSPRPAHADLPGALKYRQDDIRNILERASARETTTRVAIGAVAAEYLSLFGISSFAHVVEVGGIKANGDPASLSTDVYKSPLYCLDAVAEEKMMAAIDKAKAEGDTLGGVFEIRVRNLPPGLGSHVHWDRRADGLLAQALFSIPGIKAVELGAGFGFAHLHGSEIHDEIAYSPERGYYHRTNNSGGIDGGITTGEEIIVRVVMKPIPTLYKPLQSVDMETKEVIKAAVERSDTSVVPAAAVVGEAMVLWTLAVLCKEKFGGDHIEETLENYRNYLKYLERR